MKVVQATAPGIDGPFPLAVHSESDQFVSESIVLTGCWEPFESQVIFGYLAEIADRSPLFVDCGANLGWYSVGAGLLGVSTLACEPMPANVSLLRENVRRNDLRLVVRIHEAALGEREGMCTLYLSDNNQGDHRVHVGASSDPAKERARIEVPMTTLETVLQGRRPSLIKLDTQGSEVAILRGGFDAWMPQLNLPDVAIIAEFWPYGLTRCGSSAEEFVELLGPLIGTSHECFEVSEHLRTLTKHSEQTLRALAASRGLSQDVRGFVNLFFRPLA